MEPYQDDIGQRITSATRNSVWILAVQLSVLAALAWFGLSRHGSLGGLAAVVAGVICFVPAVVSLFCVAVTAGTPNALTGTMLSMALRTAVPFFVTIFLVEANQPLADAGLFGMVLINYLVMLGVESAVAVRMIQVLSPSTVRQ